MTVADNDVLYAHSVGGHLTIDGIAAAANSILVTDSLSAPSLSITLPSAVQDNITRLSTIVSGTWNSAVIAGQYGGTGVANTGKTITLGGNLTTSGAFATTLTVTGITGVTLPVSGTLATTSQIPTGAALSKTDDTNVTLTLGGSPTTALVNAASITAGWTGTLGLTRGGTAASLTASTGGIVYSGASALAVLSGTATANQIVMSGASAAPAWSTATYPATTTVNQLLYSSSANVIGGLATANNGVLVTSSGGVPSISSTIPSATQDNITRTGIITNGTWTATTIAVANGGTGVTSSKPIIQRISSTITTVVDVTAVTPFDNTIPQQSGESTNILSVTITPTSASNILIIQGTAWGGASVSALYNLMLFQDSTANALNTQGNFEGGGGLVQISMLHYMVAGTTSATTFKLNGGHSASGHWYINGDTGGGALYGGTSYATFSVTEIAV